MELSLSPANGLQSSFFKNRAISLVASLVEMLAEFARAASLHIALLSGNTRASERASGGQFGLSAASAQQIVPAVVAVAVVVAAAAASEKRHCARPAVVAAVVAVDIGRLQSAVVGSWQCVVVVAQCARLRECKKAREAQQAKEAHCWTGCAFEMDSRRTIERVRACRPSAID